MAETFLNGKVTLHRGDCLEVLPFLEADSIDSCVTDPPYHLTSTNRGSTPGSVAASKDVFKRVKSGGFMGKQWDGGDIAFRPEMWVEVLRVLKPGAHLIAFGGTRTYHRMACAIEDAGFEIRDQIGWCYGSGFPKSHDVSKGIDRLAGAQREVIGADKKFGRSRLEDGKTAFGDYAGAWDITAPATESAIQWQGWGTALKPAWEPCVLARKPLSESSIAANVLKHGTGGINVDGCRVAHDEPIKVMPPQKWEGREDKIIRQAIRDKETTELKPNGRWPANLIHDGSEEVLAGFPDAQGGNFPEGGKVTRAGDTCYGAFNGFDQRARAVGDSGSAARFFYTAKADTDDRLGSKHPTVKPVDLMSYLARLVTPSGGVVLDPFAGTGTTAEAAFREGLRCILIEREPEYQADIVKRMGLCLSGPDLRRASSVKQESAADLPLFGGVE